MIKITWNIYYLAFDPEDCRLSFLNYYFTLKIKTTILEQYYIRIKIEGQVQRLRPFLKSLFIIEKWEQMTYLKSY